MFLSNRFLWTLSLNSLSRLRERAGVRDAGRSFERFEDPTQNAAEIFVHLIVREPYHAPAALVEPLSPPFVICRLDDVLAAVGFDNEGTVEAREVDDELTQR